VVVTGVVVVLGCGLILVLILQGARELGKYLKARAAKLKK